MYPVFLPHDLQENVLYLIIYQSLNVSKYKIVVFKNSRWLNQNANYYHQSINLLWFLAHFRYIWLKGG
jgi:hypothetical protein